MLVGRFISPRVIAWSLVCALLVPSAAFGTPQGDEKTEPPRSGRKAGVVLTTIGIGLSAAGVVLLANARSVKSGEWFSDGTGTGVYGQRIPWLDTSRSDKLAGAVSIGVGTLLAVAGIKLLRHHPKTASARAETRAGHVNWLRPAPIEYGHVQCPNAPAERLFRFGFPLQVDERDTAHGVGAGTRVLGLDGGGAK